MINQPTQRNILPLTARTVINALRMCGATQVLIQAAQCVESFLAEVATVEAPVPRSAGGDIVSSTRRTGPMPLDLFIGEEMIPVDLSTVVVDLLTVRSRWAGTGLQVQTDSGQVGELAGAPGAFDILPDVNRGFQMLWS